MEELADYVEEEFKEDAKAFLKRLRIYLTIRAKPWVSEENANI